MDKEIFDLLHSGGIGAVILYLAVRDTILNKRNQSSNSATVHSLSQQRQEFRMDNIEKSIERIASSAEKISDNVKIMAEKISSNSKKLDHIDHKIDLNQRK